MKAVKYEFPNPVLAANRDDYIATCKFITFVHENKIAVEDDNIKVPVSYELVCDGIQKLLDSEKAKAVVRVISSAASYSRIFFFNKGKTETVLFIPKYSVVNKFSVSISVVANEDIKAFNCKNEFNELYFSNLSFEIRRGDILAASEDRIIYVDDTELEKPISSIFNIISRDDLTFDEIDTDYTGEKIAVYLSKELYQLYNEFTSFNNGVLRRYAIGIIVYPVLVEALAKIEESYKESPDEAEENTVRTHRWSRAIDCKAKQFDINLSDLQESYTAVANKLLGDVSSDALKSFKDALEDELNNGENQNIGGND